MVYRLTLSADRVEASPMDLPASPDEVALSPSGTAAALRYGDRLLIVRDVAGTAEKTEYGSGEAGAPDGMAVSDDGAWAMAAWNGRLIRFSADGALPVAGFEGAAAVAFRPGSRDAVAAGAGGLAWIRESGAVEWLASDDAELRGALVIAAAAGDKVATARRGGRTIRIAAPPGETIVFDGNCEVTALEPMQADGVFRLNVPGPGPLMLLEIGKTGARTVFVAPSMTAGEGQ
jgi:sugar lactone lactonase YvrE